MSFEEKASRKLANGQNIEDSEKRKWSKGFICTCTGVKYHNIQTCLLVYAAVSQVSVYRTIGPLVYNKPLHISKNFKCMIEVLPVKPYDLVPLFQS